ncbi:MAG: agmatine deiminase family protein [Methanobacteriota archaeon]
MKKIRTPRDDGFAMPAEWERHDACYMAWPCKPETWFGYEKEAKASYAEVAKAIDRFEHVIMLVPPRQVHEARASLGPRIELVQIELDDSWIRDNGPIFVRSASGRLAVVHFAFNGWGERYMPYEKDAAVPAILANELGLPCYHAPMVLEGGSISVDGEGTLLTTESCLLNPNRNPRLSREGIEKLLVSYLGVRKVLWLRQGMAASVVDGHIDGIVAFVAPRTVVAAIARDPSDPNYPILKENRERLEGMTDAKGHSLEIMELPLPTRRMLGDHRVATTYVNFYLANGGVVAPIFGERSDAIALAALRDAFPDRDVVGIRGEYIGVGGGVIHCITQQRPATR